MNRELFLKFNDSKYQQFQQLITNSNIRRVINAIPILLSVNQNKIPGFIEGGVPHGIIGLQPDSEAKKYIHGRFNVKNLDFNNDKPFIEMLAVMGSVGTIAYTKESDFDYWVCIDRHHVSPEMLKKFSTKVEAIQKWVVDEIKVDVHLFVNDIESIKNNIFAEDDKEAFGTTIGAVLKDEFFRSSIIIAGKVPFWWVLPRFVRDNEYEKIYRSIPDEMRENHFVDLGNLFEISKEDFLGAALFQLIKSLGNPFKSIIKIGVLEKYLLGLSYSPLLSQKVKTSILQNNIDNKMLDSYILMFEEVYDYYESVIKDERLLKILRQNLYLKINPQLSKYAGMRNRQSLPYKVIVMFKYVKEWGWSLNEINVLDNFDNWDYNKIMNFWNMVKKFMLLSYQKISTQIPTMNLAQKISESDFKLLSRKIKTHFTAEENKIDHYVTFKETPYESILYIEPANIAGKSVDMHEWNLLKRNTSAKEKFVSTILKTEPDLVKLLAWTSINQIFNPTFSRLKFQSGYSRINPEKVVELLAKISQHFAGRGTNLKNEYFLKESFNLVNMIIVNFGLENEEKIKTVHHLFLTSWGESYIDVYRSESDLVTLLMKILSDGLNYHFKYEDYCLIITPEPFKKHYKEIEQLFREAYSFIINTQKKYSARFVARVSDNYVTMCRDGGKVSVDTDSNYINLLSKITLRPKKDVLNKYFGDDSRLSILSEIYKLRRMNSIVIVYEEKGDFIFFHLLNERGNIFTYIKQTKMKEEVIINFIDFSQNVINRINSYNYLPDINNRIQVFELSIDKFGGHSFENKSKRFEEIFLVKFKNAVRQTLSSTVKKSQEGKTLYSMQFAEGITTDFVPLNKIPQICAPHLPGFRQLPILISDIVFNDLKKEDVLVGTSPYFLEKYRLEFIMNKAMR